MGNKIPLSFLDASEHAVFIATNEQLLCAKPTLASAVIVYGASSVLPASCCGAINLWHAARTAQPWETADTHRPLTGRSISHGHSCTQSSRTSLVLHRVAAVLAPACKSCTGHCMRGASDCSSQTIMQPAMRNARAARAARDAECS